VLSPHDGWVLRKQVIKAATGDVGADGGMCDPGRRSHIDKSVRVGKMVLASCMSEQSNQATLTHNPSSLKAPTLIEVDSGSWVDQSFIGGGGIGAMVGGSMLTEVIPVSCGAFYAMSRKVLRENHQVASFSSNYEVFKSMRSALMRGDVLGADTSSAKWRSSGEGQFEYLADVALTFTPPKSSVRQGPSTDMHSWHLIAGGPRAASLSPLLSDPTSSLGIAEHFLSLSESLFAPSAAPTPRPSPTIRGQKAPISTQKSRREVVKEKVLGHVQLLDLSSGLSTTQYVSPRRTYPGRALTGYYSAQPGVVHRD
jgi:hypothetical protein